MAYNSNNFSVLAYANEFTLWHYSTPDNAITTSGYLNDAADMVRVNDLIIANVDIDGAPATIFYIVTANDGNTVTISAFTA